MTPTETIEVVLALPQRCWRVQVSVEQGISAGEIVRRSGLDRICERESGETPTLGVFGRKVGADYVPQPGERLELYRSLIADPRQRRRDRARAHRGDQGSDTG